MNSIVEKRIASELNSKVCAERNLNILELRTRSIFSSKRDAVIDKTSKTFSFDGIVSCIQVK